MAERNVSVTLKAGKGYDAPWVVVTGDNAEEVRRNVAEVVNLDLGTADRYSLAEVVVFAAEAFQGTSNVVADLGAAPLDAAELDKVEQPTGGSESGDGWAAAKAKRGKSKPEAASVTEGEGQNTPSEATEAPETDEDPVLVQISQADSKAALRRVWARNKARWSEVHDEAAKVRGKELE